MLSSTPSSPRQQHVHRVVIYTTCYNVIDGVTLTIRKIEQELLAAGHHVLILTTKSGDMRNTHMDGIHSRREILFLDNSIPIPFLADPNNPAVSYHLGYSLSRDTRARLNEFEPSILHITVPDNLCLHLVQYARDKEIPLMGTYHSNIPDYMNHYPGLSWLKPLLATFFLHQYCFLQSLFVPTPYIHSYLSQQYHMDQVTNLQVWGRGIDLTKYSPCHASQKFRHSLGISDDTVVICWVGRCVPEKRTDIFASVIRRLHACGINYHALIIGRGPSEQDLKTLPNSTFYGWLTGQPLSVAYASCDVFLFPSAVETFGNVTLEAAASGLPLVVEGNCSQHLVENGVNGFGCVTEQDFFQATKKLCIDSELRKSAARASRQHALKFNKQTIVQEMLTHYSNVTEEFYLQYGGRHYNRDLRYLQQTNAFIAGSHPRPVFLALVEFIFITAFRVMTWLWIISVWFHSNVLSKLQGTRQSRRRVVASPKKPILKRSKTVEFTLMEQGGSFGEDDAATCTTASTCDLSSLGSVSSGGSSSSSSSSPAVAVVSNETTFTTNNATAGFSCTAFLDGPFVNSLAAGIIKSIAFQCRIESTIRNFIKGMICRSQKFMRKRKNSNMHLLRPRLQRGASSESESSVSRDDVLKRRLKKRSNPTI